MIPGIVAGGFQAAGGGGWNLAGATYTTEFQPTESAYYNFQFKNNGSILYTNNFLTENCTAYNLSIPWDISSAVFDYAKDLSSIHAAYENNGSMTFKDDGTQAYVLTENATRRCATMSLATPWDVRTGSRPSNGFNLPAADYRRVQSKPDGLTWYVINRQGPYIAQYSNPVAWDSVGSTLDGVSMNLLTGFPNSFRISIDGTKLIYLDRSTQTTYLYNFGTPWDITTITNTGDTFKDASRWSTQPEGMLVSDDGTKLYVTSNLTDPRTIYQYDIS